MTFNFHGALSILTFFENELTLFTEKIKRKTKKEKKGKEKKKKRKKRKEKRKEKKKVKQGERKEKRKVFICAPVFEKSILV